MSLLSVSDVQAADVLRAEGLDRAMLTRLLETSCLLELAKLGTARLDLGTFTSLAVEVLAQFLLIDGCAVFLEPDGLPPVRSRFGTIDCRTLESALETARVAGGGVATERTRSYCVQLDDAIAGVLVVAQPLPIPEIEPIFSEAVRQLAAGLALVTESERLRREAAVERARREAVQLSDRLDDEELHRVAEAVAAFPAAVGARITLVDHGVETPALTAGSLDAPVSTRHPVTAADGSLELVVEMMWAKTPVTHSLEQLGDVLALLCASLERIVRSRRLADEVETDPLTGVGNRRRAARALVAALNRAERSDESVAVVAFDIDFFKRVNDTLGHPAGDRVLQVFAELLMSSVRSYDVVARMGGEEFVVICAGSDAFGARVLAERVRRAFPEQTTNQLGVPWPVTVSAGVASCTGRGDGPDRLLAAADRALYDAKRQGRDRVVAA